MIAIPTERIEHLAYRKRMTDAGFKSDSMRERMMNQCKLDFLYWLNTFCWVYEPRPRVGEKEDERVKPFIAWPHQAAAYREMAPLLGYRDIGMIKSRGEGASWLVLMMFLHGWLFTELAYYGMVSRTEDMGDNPDNPNSLFWKLDWALSKLPGWMIAKSDIKRSRAHHTLINRSTKSIIASYSATGNVARGGRATAMLIDEFAAFEPSEAEGVPSATRDVTDCRIFLSTPQGPSGKFYDLIRDPGSVHIVKLSWRDNPTKNPGLYVVNKGKVELLDKEFWKARAGYKYDEELIHGARQIVDDTEDNPFKHRFFVGGDFVTDGLTRSVWYDDQCRRGETPRSIAQELDMDFGGSSCRFFNANKIDRAIDEHARPPAFKGTVLYDPDDLKSKVRVYAVPSGELEIWSSFLLGEQKPIREHSYALGVDVSSGSGASNSTIAIGDCDTREMCAMVVSAVIEPHVWAEWAMALGYFFSGPSGPALIVQEINGQGGLMARKRMIDAGYPNLFKRTTEDKTWRVKTNVVGFFSDATTKALLLGELRRALDLGELIIPDRACLEETKSFMILPNGKIEHVEESTSSDPSGAGANHGDRVIAAGCMWKGMCDSGHMLRGPAERAKITKPPPEHSFAGRMAQFQKLAKATTRW